MPLVTIPRLAPACRLSGWCALLSLALLLGACTSTGNTNRTPRTWSKGGLQGKKQEQTAEAKPEQERGRSILETGPVAMPDARASTDGGATGLASEGGASADMITLRAQIYEAMGQMSRAQAVRDTLAMEAALDEAMAGIRHLARTPDVLEEAEVRELYRSVITAYEQYYGVSDTLGLAYGAIYAFRDAMFSSMNALRAPLLEDVLLPPMRTVTATVPLHTNRLVEQSIQYLVRNPDNHLNRWLSRAHTYFPMVEQILREEGVPDELKYLAMIESGLNPYARSRVGAVGMWQFMSATGQAYGLKVSHWVDERRDPEKSTQAAAQYLRDLHKQFGDWHLALAAYNSGPGRVRGALRKAGGRQGDHHTFWDIYQHLPRETRNYVPMFIATVLVASNPDAFGIASVAPGPRYAYDVATVEGMVSLQAAAEMARTDVETLRALNPEIRQNMTPPSRSVYRLRLPLGSYSRFTTAYASLPTDRRRGVAPYRVRRGDTLSKIARQYGTTVAELQAVNGLSGSTIRAGQELQVPIRQGDYAGATSASADHSVQYQPSNVRFASDATSGATTTSAPPASSGRTASAQPKATQPKAAAAEGTTRVRYRVRRGDTLGKIASRQGVTIADLKRWNNLSGDRIQSGQMLTIYPAGTAAPSREQVTHRVRKGESLARVARRYGVRISDLKRWNDLSGDRIVVGQRLKVYPGSAGAASGSKRWVSHQVKRGENLTTIAKKYGATVADLRKWNNLKTDRLRVGQRLAVYTR